jgi:hypothetical protein
MNHPKPPLRAIRSFAHGVRWALCGADPALDAELFNFRSADNGKTWQVNDTGIALSAHHAGDEVRITLVNPNAGRMRLISLVISLDETCTTTDGGRTWGHCTRRQPDLPR